MTPISSQWETLQFLSVIYWMVKVQISNHLFSLIEMKPHQKKVSALLHTSSPPRMWSIVTVVDMPLLAASLIVSGFMQVNDAVVEVVEGDARNVLCEAVEKHHASMLVVGSHGYGAIKR